MLQFAAINETTAVADPVAAAETALRDPERREQIGRDLAFLCLESGILRVHRARKWWQPWRARSTVERYYLRDGRLVKL